MAYAIRKNDYNTATQLNLANYSSLFSLIYFDLTYQTEKVTRDPKQLIFRYRLSANTDQNFTVHVVVLYEEILTINKIGNELACENIHFSSLFAADIPSGEERGSRNGCFRRLGNE